MKPLARFVALAATATLAATALAQSAERPSAGSQSTPRTANITTTAPEAAEGTSTPHRNAGNAAAPVVSQPAPAKAADPKAEAERQKQELDAAMDRVVKRWKARAAAEGWKTQAAAGTKTQAVRSEKQGTAPPSPDPKQPRAGTEVR